jgi:DNA-directed RNA polymerase specialized sigma24 family protein
MQQRKWQTRYEPHDSHELEQASALAFDTRADDVESPLRSFLAREALGTLRDVIPTLSAAQQDLFRLLVEGYSPADALRELDLTWSAYQSLQRRLKRYLQRRFPDQDV